MLTRYRTITAMALLALVAATFWFSASPLSTSAQGYSASLTVDGQSLGGGAVPTVSSTPTFSGTGTPGTPVTIRIEPGAVALNTTVGADGKFSVKVTQALPPATYQTFISNELAGSFKVAAPAPPATGNGLTDVTGGSTAWLVVLVATALLVGVGGTLVARGHKQKP